MSYFGKTYQEILTDSLEDLASTTNLTRLSSGSKVRAILESVSKRLEEAYDIFDLNMARAFVSSAPGQYLELIGELLGVTREGKIAAIATTDTQVLRFYVSSGTFGDINSGSDIVIPQGTLLSTESGNGGILYRIIEEVVLPAGQSAGWFSAEASVPGDASNVGTNTLIYHSFIDYTDYLNNTLLVQNIHQIANGKNFESDTNFRFRIANRVLEAEAANFTAIRLAVLSTPGVADAILMRRYRGIGTFGVIIKSVLPTVSSDLIAAVQSNVERVQSMGTLSFIRKPLETGLSMKITVHYRQRLKTDEYQQIEQSLEGNIRDYINSLDIGETFSINRMISNLFGISDQVTNFGEIGQPIDELYVYKETRLQDNKIREKLLSDYVAATDERIIVEPSISSPIVFSRAFTRR